MFTRPVVIISKLGWEEQFISLSTVDTLGQMALCCERYPVHCRIFKSILASTPRCQQHPPSFLSLTKKCLQTFAECFLMGRGTERLKLIQLLFQLVSGVGKTLSLFGSNCLSATYSLYWETMRILCVFCESKGNTGSFQKCLEYRKGKKS